MGKYSITCLIILIITLSCSQKITSEDSESEKKAKDLLINIKSENYTEIYDASAACLKTNYSKKELTELLKKVVNQLKFVDEKLNFVDYDQTELSLDDKWTTYQNFALGYREIEIGKDKVFKNGKTLLAKGDKQALILTAWQNDENFKLSAFQVLIKEGNSKRWLGTSSCKTTKRE